MKNLKYVIIIVVSLVVLGILIFAIVNKKKSFDQYNSFILDEPDNEIIAPAATQTDHYEDVIRFMDSNNIKGDITYVLDPEYTEEVTPAFNAGYEYCYLVTDSGKTVYVIVIDNNVPMVYQTYTY